MITKNIKQIVMAVTVSCGAAAVITACSDKWDDHYEGTASGVEVNSVSLWEAIQGNPELSNFASVVSATGYANQLNSSQKFTVFAPANSQFSAEEAQQLINQYQQEKLTKKDEDNTVLKEFVKNHVALYNYSTSAGSVDSVRLLNGKYTVLQSGEVGGVKTVTDNGLYRNGVLFTVAGQLTYQPNIFEYINKDPDLADLKSFLYDPSYYYKEFDPSQSVVDSVKDGKTIYMDSVSIQKNRLFAKLNDNELWAEDSTYWMVMPTNTVWKELVEKYTKYFNYSKKVQDRDSMNYVNTRLAILKGTVFSKSYNKSVFANQSSGTTQVTDSALSESAVQAYHDRTKEWGKDFNYYEYLNPWRPGGVFDQPADNVVTCSNGLARKATTWPIDTLETFMRYNIIEGESDNIQEYSKIPNPKKEGDSIQTITPIIRNVTAHEVDSLNFYDRVWNNQFVEFDVQESSYTSHSVTYKLKNILSNMPYDIYVVTSPALAYNPNSSSFERLPTKLRCTLYYPDEDGKAKNVQLVSAEETTADKIDYIPLHADKYADGFVFPTSNYDLDEESPSFKLQIQTRITSSDFNNNKYSRTMRIDCILLAPHGTLDLSDPNVVKMTPHGDYNGANLRSWTMKR